MNDDELRSILKSWQAPAAPATLRTRVFKPRWGRWLLFGEIRMPVPVALAVCCLLLLVMYRATRPTSTSLSDFKQVDQFQPRIVRTTYATR